ncbi:MAG: SAM-dependent DNA methyltransferase [Phormidesmis sp. RL_2_1]|nr:SAM-dependent DNA methyltransferase [Phormidesmis sp. RL_2_1]
MNQQQKEFLMQLESISGSRSAHNVFSDWLKMSAVAFHQMPYHTGDLRKDKQFYSLEADYMESIKPYSKGELTVLRELLGLTISAHQNRFYDFLGEIAGEANLLSKRSGQFFTPSHICRLMAKMSVGNIEAQVKEKSILTVCEPAVGAGATIIAVAEEVAAQGIDPRAHLQFDCTDISYDAFNMAYIQLSALGLQAVVRHGNTLSGEYWEHRATPQFRLFHQWLEAQQRPQRLVQAMRLLLEDEIPSKDCEIAPVPEPATTLFDVDALTVEKIRKQQDRPQPDILLAKQMNLLGG